MEAFFLGIGIDIFKDYLKDLLEYGTDSIFKMIDNLAKKYGEKDVIECFPEIYKEINDKILKQFDKIMEKNIIDYKNDTQLFKKFKKDKVVKEIEIIFQKLDFENDIKKKSKTIFNDNSQIGKDFGVLNILLNGDEENIKKFIEIFNINKNDKNEYYFKNEINLLKDTIKQIKLFDNKNINNNNIDYIWEFIGVTKINNEIKDKDNSKNGNISDNIPIIYVYFKDELEIEKIDNFTNLNLSVDNLNYIRLFSNYIIDTNNNSTSNSSDKKILFNLVEKTVLNILINKYKKDKETKSNKIIDGINTHNPKFSFGNKIDYLYIMNYQEVKSIFKELLGEEILDKNKNYSEFIKQLLKSYQKDIIEVKNTFLSDVFNKIINPHNLQEIVKEITFNEKDEIKKLINEVMNKIISNLSYKSDNSNKIDSINKMINIKLEDYLLQSSCSFINELITNTLKEGIIKIYAISIIKNYYEIHNKEYVFID